MRYSFRFVPEGDAYYRDRLTGHTTLRRLDLSGSAFLARTNARVLAPEGEEYSIEVLRGPAEVSVLDHRLKTLRWSSLAAFGPVLQAAVEPAMMYPFYDPRSLVGEAEATRVTLEGSGHVVGEACWWVRVAYEDDEEDSRWCLSKRDAIPRAMEWIAGEARRTLEIFELETLETAPELFAELEVPADYEIVEASFGPSRGSRAEDWVLVASSGEEVSLADQLGSVVVLDFFATWCAPCVSGMQGLEVLLREYRGQPVRAFAVNTMEERAPAEVIAFADGLGVTYPLLLGGDELHQAYAAGSIPAVVVLDGQGRHVGMTIGYLGELTEIHLRELIDEALASATQSRSRAKRDRGDT